MKKDEEGGPIFNSPEFQQEALNRSRHDCIAKGGHDGWLVDLHTFINSSAKTSGSSCPSIWDGILCWAETPAGKLQSQQCPAYIAGFDHQANASRLCTEEGHWLTHPGGLNSSWTNYSMCYSEPLATVLVRLPDIANASHITSLMPMVKRIRHVGYTFSLLSLIVALCILASTKRLRCPRNTLHMHLFVSFILRASMALLKDSLFVQGVGLPSDVIVKDGQSYFSQQQYNWVCKSMMSLWQFCIMANYSWILMEGLYLHSLIFMALFTDSSAITFYLVLGWGLPVLVVIPWIALRTAFEDDFCWTTQQSSVHLVLRIPIVLSNLINFVLFLNIIRVLFLKLRSSICEETRRYRYRKWGRSTLVLMPLFGVHYSLLLSMNIVQNPTVEVWWIFFDQLFTAFQGLCVAILYCFMNGEVRTELSKKWRHVRLPWCCSGPPPVAGGRVSGSGTVGGAAIVMGGRRLRWSPTSCTSNCSMMESRQPSLVMRRASDHVCCCTNLSGIERIEGERLLHPAVIPDQDAPVLEMRFLKS